MHDAAIDVLNDLRSQCLSRILGIEPMQLVGVMRELRMRLFEENPDLELILMIEDFTLVQVIQYDLLEAMIELPRREGQQIMCTMKTVMAVTDGFFTRMLASSDALRTRISAIGHVYNLDVQYGTDFSERARPGGRGGLRRAIPQRGARGRGGPRGLGSCRARRLQVCAHRDSAMRRSVRSGPDGHGLYPFNAVALDRMVRTRQDSSTLGICSPSWRSPSLPTCKRSKMGDSRPKVGLGNFDPDQFTANRLSRPCRCACGDRSISCSNPSSGGILLTFWAGAPDEVGNLPEGIHEAFDIPLATDVRTARATVAEPAAQPIPRPGGVDHAAEALRAWLDGARLDGDSARVIRRACVKPSSPQSIPRPS